MAQNDKVLPQVLPSLHALAAGLHSSGATLALIGPGIQVGGTGRGHSWEAQAGGTDLGEEVEAGWVFWGQLAGSFISWGVEGKQSACAWVRGSWLVVILSLNTDSYT